MNGGYPAFTSTSGNAESPGTVGCSTYTYIHAQAT